MKKYEKPVIIKLQSGFMNKWGNSPAYSRKIRKNIESITIEDITSQYGSPVFVFSESKIRRTYRTLRDSFTSRYPNVIFAWSYKTNYLGAITAIYHQEGSIAEVVSEMEYDMAKKQGMTGTQIIYNGPHKSEKSLIMAAKDGARINIDHLDEMVQLEKIADELSIKIPVGIRLNMDTGIQPQWTRFGFNLDSGQALEAVKRITSSERLELRGLHCHQGTFILDPDSYAKEVKKIAEFAILLQEKLNCTIDYLDIGGGFPSRSNLKGTYLPPDLAVPSLDEYGEKITSELFRTLPAGYFPELILETGRALIDESGWLITTVEASKRLPDGRRSYVLDAGVNTLFTSFWYRYTIEIDREVSGISEPSVLNGPLCMNIDVIDESALLPALSRGSKLILSPVGAYNVTQSMQFIEYKPAVILIAEDGTTHCIREKEDLSDVQRRESIPPHLQKGKN
jgi:diaminopimelate decarboxylase